MLVDSGDGLAARRERHIGRMQAYLDAFKICRAVIARFTSVGTPDEKASTEEWRSFGRSAVAAFEDLSERMTELRHQIYEESAVMRQELRSEREAGSEHGDGPIEGPSGRRRL